MLKCILRVKETEVLTDPYWICYVSPKWKEIFTSFYVLAKPEVFLLHGRRLARNQAALSLPMCLEAKLNPRCSTSFLLDKLILGIVTENWFVSWQALSRSKCLVRLANVRLFLSSHASFAIPCNRHASWCQRSRFLHEVQRSLLERPQLESRSKTSPVALRPTEAWPRRSAAAGFASVRRATRQHRAALRGSPPAFPIAQLSGEHGMDVTSTLLCFMVLLSEIYRYGNLLLHCGVSKCCDVQLVDKLSAWSGIGRGIAVRLYIRKKMEVQILRGVRKSCSGIM